MSPHMCAAYPHKTNDNNSHYGFWCYILYVPIRRPGLDWINMFYIYVLFALMFFWHIADCDVLLVVVGQWIEFKDLLELSRILLLDFI